MNLGQLSKTDPEQPAQAERQPQPQRVTTVAADPASGNSLPLWPLAIAAFAGALVAVLLVPAWVPIIGGSLTGADPKVYWYVSRAAGLTAFVLLWLSMASGLIITNKMARVWPGAFTAFDLHQFTSLLGLAFIVVHVLALLGNRYVPYDLIQLLVPFTNTAYRPVWVAVGQIALYLFIPVTFTFYIRKQMGNRLWHLVHLASYAVFAMSLLHGLFSGTDSTSMWVVSMYWLSGLSLLALTIHRVNVSRGTAKKVNPRQISKAWGA